MNTKLLVGRYEVIEKIGEGGMAVVYKAKDKLLNRYVALKILRPEFTKDVNFIENFKRESQAAAGLSHPNIVNVYDVGKEGNINFIVMELIDGKPLSEVIKEVGKLDYHEAISIAKQVASALSLAHKNQIVHRDVKPHNIIITSQGTAKLTDFGIARAVSQKTIAEGNEKIMGSVHYFSPEQARGAYVDERSDIYSLGIVMYEMLTGKVPFDGDNPISIALMHINEPMPSVLEEVPGIPPQLERVINKCTDKFQNNRYGSADDIIEELDNIEFISRVIGKNHEDRGEIVSAAPIKERTEQDVIREELERDLAGEDKPKNKTKLFIIIAAAIILIGGIIGMGAMMGWFAGDKDNIAVPNFIGMTIEEAKTLASEKGLEITELGTAYSPDQEAGLICSQTPSKDSKVEKGQVIQVVISQGKRDGVVPSLIGMDYKEAKAYLEGFGFELGMVEKETNSKPANTIIWQSIEAGGTAKSGQEIDIKVSDGKGKEMVAVPKLVGKTVDEAKAMIVDLGFIPDIVYEESTSVEKNVVMEQEYSAGTEIEKGSVIGLKVSKGAPQTPTSDTEG